MKRITKPVLIFLAVVAICMGSFQGMNAFTNFKVLPVTSDLMEPAIFRGSLMFMEKVPEENLKPGDIIAVGLPNQQNHAIGRLIQSNQMSDNYYTLSFKGDSRTLPESFPYTVKDSTYVNKLSIPLIGLLFAFLASPFGLIIFTGAALYFAWYYIFKLHDRMSWNERNQRRLSYNRKVALEISEKRHTYGSLEMFFNDEDTVPEDSNESHHDEENNSEVKEQTL